MTLQRRDVLKTATALPIVAMAGCTGVFAGSEQPAYGEDTPRGGADDDDGVFFVHIDASWLRAFDGEEELPYADELPDAVDLDLDSDSPPVDVDPLVAYPTTGLVIGALGLGFGLYPYGFGDVVLEGLDEDAVPENESGNGDADEGTDDVDGSVRIDSVLLVDGVGVFRGAFDARTVVAASDGFEPADERDGFDVYEGTAEGLFGTDGRQFAVKDDVLVTALDEDSDLDSVLDATTGGVDRLGDDDDGGWALTEAGHGHVTIGAWGVEPDEATADEQVDREFVDAADVFADADGLVSSVTLGPEEGNGSIAAVFPEGKTPQRAAVENQVGTSASTRDVEIDGTRVSVTGTWRVAAEDDD
ncbi:hypothetical protein [Halosolutus halophilus]|uniref:hypothetical protein n=1 Tax=Halosolutus halophilus TaxID=1552990 RepID=UPI0022350D43|nr:hypothetical protein [Halosolutus halophilus]